MQRELIRQQEGKDCGSLRGILFVRLLANKCNRPPRLDRTADRRIVARLTEEGERYYTLTHTNERTRLRCIRL